MGQVLVLMIYHLAIGGRGLDAWEMRYAHMTYRYWLADDVRWLWGDEGLRASHGWVPCWGGVKLGHSGRKRERK